MTSPENIVNRRHSQRISLTVRVKIVWEGGNFSGYSIDVSKGGIFVETTQLLPVGTRVGLTFTIRGEVKSQTVQVAGCVTRMVTLELGQSWGGLPGIGIAFQRFANGEAELGNELDRRLARAQTTVATQRPTRKEGGAVAGLPVAWNAPTRPSRTGLLINVSSAGAFVATEEPASPGTRIYVTFQLPVYGVEETVRVIGEVVPAEELNSLPDELRPSGMGIRLVQSSVETRDMVRFVREQLRHLVRVAELEARDRMKGRELRIERRKRREEVEEPPESIVRVPEVKAAPRAEIQPEPVVKVVQPVLPPELPPEPQLEEPLAPEIGANPAEEGTARQVTLGQILEVTKSDSPESSPAEQRKPDPVPVEPDDFKGAPLRISQPVFFTLLGILLIWVLFSLFT